MCYTGFSVEIQIKFANIEKNCLTENLPVLSGQIS